MAFASVESSGGRKWSDGELRVEDEFTCSAALRGAVLALQATVKRVFDVELDISVEEGVEVHQTGLMWLQLKGKSGDVLAAKLFVRGVVNQEEQQEVTYPEVLHCVFCGARGLFMDCLIRNTSAHIMVGSPGCLLISGLAEPVVRAYSLIVDLVERYDSSQGRRMDAGARGTGESLDSRRSFKDLVERWDDRHTLDLLVLPVSVKEVLLELVRESRWNMATAAAQETVMPQMDMDEPEVVDQSATAMDRLSQRMPAEQLDTSLLSPGSSVVPTRSDVGSPLSQQHQGVVLPSATPGREPPDPFFRSFAVVDGAPQGQVEGADEQQGWGGSVPQEVMDEASRMEISTGAEAGGRQDDLGLLLKFFTAMGFKEDTVNRVLSRTGPLDPCDLLELVQQEQGLEDRGGGGEEDISRRSGDGAEEEPNFSGRAVEKGALSYSTGLGRFGDRSPGEGLRSSGGGEEKEEVNDDFVLGVVKRAAASCGYPEDQVREVFSNLPELSSHQLLLELQRQGKRDSKPLGANITEAATAAATATLTAQQRAKESLADSSRKEGCEVTRRKAEESGALRVAEGKASVDNRNKEKDRVSQGKLLGRQPSAKAMASFDSDGLVEHREIEKILIDQAYRNSSQEASAKSVTPVVTESHDNVHKRPPVAGVGGGNTRTQNWNTLHHQNHQNHPRGPSRVDPTPNGGSSSIRGPPRPRYPHEMHIPDQMNPNMLATTPGFFLRPHQRPGLPQMGKGAIVTGQQRFLEGLQMPFELKLSGDTGDSSLRQIIIDGSNVAMSHGLGQYFSCRGIALAVQHFWDRGHRKISALVPQWRQKRDPRVKEQEYMFRLQDLGLLSFTPSREVMGKRINSYDDRFMLQLAQKTNGVIVTNDNMRDLFDESDDFKDIIRKSLLQYTFVGDHFMVPDDPLGRDGPHLNDFLRSHQSTRKFSGSSFTNPPAQHQRPQPEPLQFHNRPPGGNRVTPEFQSDHLDLQSQGWEQVQRRGGRGGGGGGGRGRMEPQMQRQRSAEETSRLRASLMQVFPDQASTVDQVLQRHPVLTDVNRLSDLILEP